MQRFLILYIILLINAAVIYGQPTTAGRDFWLSFGRNNAVPPSKMQIKIVTKENTDTVTITYTNGGASLYGGGIGPNTAFRGNDPIVAEVYSNSNDTSSKSLHIRTNKDVFVYAVNMGKNSTDATSILPTNALDTSYYLLSYTPTSLDGYTIVAVDTGTTIIRENGIIKATLNQGQVYSSYFPSDGSGKYLTSNKNFACFTTNPSTDVSANVNLPASCLYEQIYPTKWWGRHFFVPVTIRGKERVRVLALQDSTEIYTDATFVAGSLPLSKGGWAEFEVIADSAQKGCYIKTTHPVAVASYLTGQGYGGLSYPSGAPSMTWIPPVEQYVNEINIAPFRFDVCSFDSVSQSALREHYLLIVAPTSVKDSTKIKKLSSLEDCNGTSDVTYNNLSGGVWYDHPSGYSYYNLRLTNPLITYYSIINSESLLVYAYGLGTNESYYYVAGTTPLEDTYFTINDKKHQLFKDTIIFCDGNINVKAVIKYRMDTTISGHLRWEINGVPQPAFTDSLQWTTNLPVGNHTVTMIAKYKYNNEPDTLFASFIVSEHKDTLIKDSICQSSFLYYVDGVPIAYDQYGFKVPVQYTAGLFKDSLINLKTVSDCDSIVRLELTVIPILRDTVPKEICAGDSLLFNGIYYRQDSTYDIRLTSSFGCNIFVQLQLTVTPADTTFIYDTICQGKSYNENGFSLDTQTIANTTLPYFSVTIPNSQGCDSIITLYLTIIEPAQSLVFDTTICDGESYIFFDTTITTSGTYIYIDTIFCDTIVTLNLIVKDCGKIKVEPLAEICADNEFIYFYYTILEGIVNSYSVIFNQQAIDEGFEDITRRTLTANPIEIPVPQKISPNYVRPNHNYSFTISFEYETDTINYTFNFDILYPSWIMQQKHNNVIALLNQYYNGGYVWSAYEWYMNGTKISIDRGSHIYTPDYGEATLKFGQEYRVLLTRIDDDGVQILTCKLIPEPRTDITQFPTIVSPLQTFQIQANKKMKVRIWTVMGIKISEQNLQIGENEITAPYAEGIYLLQFFSETGTSETIKIVVKK